MEKIRKSKRLTLNVSMAIGCFVFILVLCSILSIVSFNIAQTTLYSRYQSQMKSIADIALSSVDIDDMSECSRTLEESEKYKTTQAFFDNMATNYGGDMHYLHMFKVTEPGDPLGENVVVEVCAGNSDYEKENDPDMVMHLGDHDTPEEPWFELEMIEKFKEILAGDADVFFFQPSYWGTDYTLARPLIDSQNRHFALLCVDVDANEISGSINKIVIASVTLIVGIGFVFSILLLIYMYFSVIKPIKILQSIVSSFAEENHDMNNPDDIVFHAPKTAHSKEISELSNAVEKMSLEMRDYVVDILNKNKEVENLKSSVEEMNVIAHQDALTGIKNRAAYDKEVYLLNEKILEGTARFALVMVDINDLKRINDQFGHDSGNTYIVGSTKIAADVYKNSQLFRVGGDEVVIVLTDDDYQNRYRLLEEIKRRYLRASQNTTVKPFERYSAAVGMATYEKGVDKNVDSVFQKADKAMYDNKAEIKDVK